MSVNQIDANGIETKSIDDIVSALTLAFQTIYGSDVNLDQNSPDGQLLYQIALKCYDHGNFVKQSYSSKDPDQAVGVALDAVSQLCGISRRGGTYTEVDITVVADRSVNLNGQDTSTPFTIKDPTGNTFELITSDSLSAGSNTLAFRSTEIGNVQISLNSLTSIVTPILGIVSVNNPAAPTTQGEDQETDAVFRLRRQACIALPAQSTFNGLIGGLNTVTGLTEAVVVENTTSSADGDGVPANGIWVIVRGGDDEDIGNMIYAYHPLGIPMKGSESVEITQSDGSTIDMLFDRAVAQDLYISFTATSKSGESVDTAALKAALATALTYSIYETADVTSIIAAIYAINPDVVVSDCGVSDTAGSYLTTKTPTDRENYWTVSADDITIS